MTNNEKFCAYINACKNPMATLVTLMAICDKNGDAAQQYPYACAALGKEESVHD